MNEYLGQGHCDYNHHRPHSKLRWLKPTDYAARWQYNDELEGRSSGAFNDVLTLC